MDALKALQNLGLGPETTGPEGDKLLQQAQQVWAMLDDMADKDPQAYKRFIDKQAKEHKELTAPPQPHMSVKTQFKTHGGETLFVNIVSWPRVPKPKSREDNIPLYAAPLDSFKEKKTGDTVSTVTIATNPEVLAEYGQEAHSGEERNAFINLCLDYVQHLCGRVVHRNFILLPRSTNFKGDLEKAQKFFTDSLKKAMKKDSSSATEEHAPMPDIDLPDSMLHRLASISTTSDQNNQSNGPSHKMSDDGPIMLPETLRSEKQLPKKSLIQELPMEGAKLCKPKYSLERSRSEEHLVLRVELPGVKSVSDCQLDISEDDVQLHVEGRYELTVQLPSCIDDAEARAKFNKKQSSLTLHMPIVSS